MGTLRPHPSTTNMRLTSICIAAALIPITITATQAQGTSVEPFVAELFEGFETQHTQVGGPHPPVGAPCVLGELFGGQATLCSLESPFLISVNGGSQATCGLTHRTGSFQAGSLFRDFQIHFENDMEYFGGYFATDNLGVGDSNFVQIEFLDRLGISLGVVQEVLYDGCGQYKWFGWHVPGMASIKFDPITDDMTTYMDDLFASPMEPIGRLACSPNENSLEQRAYCAASGSTFALVNDLTLHASQLPTNTLGIFLCSQTPGFIALPGNSEGNLCLGGAIGRFNSLSQILFSGASGAYSLPLDLQALPQPNGPAAAQAGETWYFQSWFRDFDGTSQMNPTSNFTSSLKIQFQ